MNNNINVAVGGPINADYPKVYKTKFLKPGIPFSLQVTEPDTKYVIKHNFELDSDVTVPANCVLQFDGGSISGSYTLTGNKTKINSDVAYNIFNNVEIVNFELPYIDVRWFGAVSDYNEILKTGTDNATAFTRAINHIGKHYNGLHIKLVGKYYIGTNISTSYDVCIWGEHTPSRISNEKTDIIDNTSPSLIAVGAVTAFTMIGRSINPEEINKWAYFSIKNIKVVGTDNSSVFIRYEASGKPSRVSQVLDCEYCNLSKVFYIHGTGDTVLGNLTIQGVLAYYNGRFIESDSLNNVRTICNLAIRDSNIEQNGKNAILLDYCFGSVIIDNCILEGQPNPIKSTNHLGSLVITNCYFEGNDNELSDTDNYTIFYEGTGESKCILKYKNNYSDTDNSVSINAYGCIVDAEFENLSNDCVFNACYVLSNPVSFRLPWIKEDCFVSFKDFFFGDMEANTNDADGNINMINGDVIGCNIPQNSTKQLTYHSSLVLDDHYYMTFFSKQSMYTYYDFDTGSGDPDKGIQIRNGLNVGRLKCTTASDTQFRLKATGSELFISRPVLYEDGISHADIKVLDTSHRYIGNKDNLSNVSSKPKGLQAFDSTNKPLFWNGTNWVDATGATV